MLETSPLSSLCATRLRIVVSFLGRRLRAGNKRNGLSAVKLSILGQLYRFGPASPKDLAKREGVQLQALSRVLAEVESEGWVLREAHETDGRRSVLSLTTQGRQRLASEVREREAALAAVLETSLNADERAQVLAACALLDRVCQAHDTETDA